MATLKIYDSQGKRLDSDGAPEVSERIENFFFGGVRLYLETGRETEIVAFFRARESKASRANQYYAVYRTDDMRQLFERFKQDLRRRVEDEFGMTLQTTSDDVQLFAKLDSKPSSVPGSNADHDAISTLLGRGERVRVGVGGPDDALGLAVKFVQGSASSIAIAEKTDIDELEGCDLAIELGASTGLEPLGETEDRFEAIHPAYGTDDSSGRPKATGSGSGAAAAGRPRAGTDESGGRSRLRTIAIAASAIGLVAVLLVGGVVAAGMMNVGPAATFFADDPTLNATLEVDGEDHALVEDGDAVGPIEITASNETPSVVVETNQEQVFVEHRIDGEVVEATTLSRGPTRSVSQDLSPAEPGEWTLRIAVGDDPENDGVELESAVEIIITDGDESDETNGSEDGDGEGTSDDGTDDGTSDDGGSDGDDEETSTDDAGDDGTSGDDSTTDDTGDE